MFRLKLVPDNTTIRFMGKRTAFFIVSALLVMGSIGLFVGKGLNYGIDFTGGILIEIKTDGPADIGAMRRDIGNLGLGSVELQEFGAPDDVLIRIQRQDGGEEGQQLAVTLVKDTLGSVVVEYRRVETVGPKVSEELFWNGVMAVCLALVAIMIYIWLRFEWQFGAAAIAALIHDVIATIGIFSLLGLEFNLATVAAVLTIAGYSINDTVVVFDRVRENLRKYKKTALPELFDISINDVLSRTVMTSVTTLLALVSLYTLGGDVIRDFSFAMIWGVLIGTYSSICVAVPLLIYLDVRRGGITDDGEGAEGSAPEKVS